VAQLAKRDPRGEDAGGRAQSMAMIRARLTSQMNRSRPPGQAAAELGDAAVGAAVRHRADPAPGLTLRMACGPRGCHQMTACKRTGEAGASQVVVEQVPAARTASEERINLVTGAA